MSCTDQCSIQHHQSPVEPDLHLVGCYLLCNHHWSDDVPLNAVLHFTIRDKKVLSSNGHIFGQTSLPVSKVTVNRQLFSIPLEPPASSSKSKVPNVTGELIIEAWYEFKVCTLLRKLKANSVRLSQTLQKLNSKLFRLMSLKRKRNRKRPGRDERYLTENSINRRQSSQKLKRRNTKLFAKLFNLPATEKLLFGMSTAECSETGHRLLCLIPASHITPWKALLFHKLYMLPFKCTGN